MVLFIALILFVGSTLNYAVPPQTLIHATTPMNYQISDVLNENLRQAKIDSANLERIDFWNERAAEIK
jgi:hypothetical protein